MNDGLIHFQCPICRTRLVTRAANADQNVECPGCDTHLAVPFLPPDAPPDDVLMAEEAAITFRELREDNEAEMDLTPMVDVTFLLLIFFMVTTAFTMQKSFQVPTLNEDVPSTNVQQLIDGDVITVRIDEFNTFFVSAPSWDEELEAPSEQDLLRRLREAKQGDGRSAPPSTLIVEAHGDALYDKVVMAMDAGSEVGMEEVKLRTTDN